MAQSIYVASHDPKGGIVQFLLSHDGKLTFLEQYPLDRPAHLCAEGNRMYALLREPFMMQSGVAEFEIRKDGTLIANGSIQPAHGTVGAHILCHKGVVYTANYLTGTTTRMPDTVLAHSGSGVHPRQDCSHPHCLTLTPQGDYICITDLGTDCIYICTPELREVSRVKLPAGSGPRQLVFSPDGKFAYCANELDSTVSVLRYEAGTFQHLGCCSTLPEGYSGESYSGAIRISSDGRTLCVSNRGHDSVAFFEAEGEVLRLKGHISTGGKAPWDISLMGKFLLCANDGDGSIVVIDLETEAMTDKVEIPHPRCILTL